MIGNGQARVIRSAEARRMPWRNGGGETVEILADPPVRGHDAFDWRVSLARIDRDGPFSAFPAVDRVFAVVDGAGVELEFGPGLPLRLTRDADPLAFPGEVPCRCRLLDGPVTALNVMTARDAFTCAVTRLDPGRDLSMTAEAITIVVCTEGSIATSLGTVERHDAVLIPVGASIHFDSGSSSSRGFVAVFGLIDGSHCP